MYRGFRSGQLTRQLAKQFLPWVLGLVVLLVVLSRIGSAPSGRAVADYRLGHRETRYEFGPMMEARGGKVGAELGVKQGSFATATLEGWPSCEKYYLIDIWETQENYVDIANVPQQVQDKFYLETLGRTKKFEGKRVLLRNFTSDAVQYIPDSSLDYVYVDARHDYCGVMEDLTLYWPKLKIGGVMSGHDWKYANEVNGQDWSICGNGSVFPGAVRGAVEDFVRNTYGSIGDRIVVTNEPWASWALVKV